MHLPPHAAAFLLFLQRRAPSTTFRIIRRYGGIALVPLGIVDGSVIPTFGSLDLLTAYLSARDADLWPYYAAMALLGAVIGAWISYRLGCRVGTRWLARHIGPNRASQIKNAMEHYGAGAVLVSTLAPPPFPASFFFLAAGAGHYPAKKFLASVIGGRALRYALLAVVAAHYGRRVVHYFRHPAQFLVPSLAVTAVLITAAAVYLFSRRHAALSREAQS